MNELVTPNENNLLSIKEVVGRTKYTRDYIAKLARDGLIVGVMVGRQWFIDEASLSRFSETTELELVVRNRQLSNRRRREREVKQDIESRLASVSADSRYSVARAITLAFMVVIVGGLTSYSAYVTPPFFVSYVMSQNAQSPLALEFYTDKSLADTTPRLESPTVLAESGQRVVFENSVEVRSFASSTDGLLLLPAEGSLASEQEIAALFSDPVTLEYTADHSGTVVSARLGTTSSALVRFVAVPTQISQLSEGEGNSDRGNNVLP